MILKVPSASKPLAYGWILNKCLLNKNAYNYQKSKDWKCRIQPTHTALIQSRENVEPLENQSQSHKLYRGDRRNNIQTRATLLEVVTYSCSQNIQWKFRDEPWFPAEIKQEAEQPLEREALTWDLSENEGAIERNQCWQRQAEAGMGGKM